MLSIKINVPVKVAYARTGNKQDGTPFAVVKIAENENSESKSKSYIKAWGNELDERIKDGCMAVLKSFDGVDLVHSKIGERYGKPEFRDEFFIRGAVWEFVGER